MDKLLIEGGVPLSGEVSISGAKNAALPLLCAALLTEEPLHLSNVPHLNDVSTMLRLLVQMGVDVTLDEKNSLVLDAGGLDKPEAPYDMVKTMRASILTLGPLLARTARARVSLPGGCAIGARPVDIHIRGLQAMGAEIRVEHGYILAQAKRLRGARIFCDLVTVTGTENLMMAAALADGVTVIENAAREPEVVDLAHCLNAMGAKVSGAGSDVDHHRGRRAAHRRAAPHHARPHRDRHLPRRRRRDRRPGAAERHALRHPRRGGREAARGRRQDRLPRRTPSRSLPKAPLNAVSLRTAPYPAFPTDMQAQFMALNCVARRHGDGDRDHLREPLHARPGVAPPGRRHRDQRQHADGEGRAAARRRHRHGHRPARLGLPGRRRPGGAQARP